MRYEIFSCTFEFSVYGLHMQTYSLVRHKKATEWCYTQLGDLLRADFQFKNPTECLRDNGFKANFESKTAKAPNPCKQKNNYTNICPLNLFSLTAQYWLLAQTDLLATLSASPGRCV